MKNLLSQWVKEAARKAPKLKATREVRILSPSPPREAPQGRGRQAQPLRGMMGQGSGACAARAGVPQRARATQEEGIVSEERLKLAVFIDFDNIQIGVKDTLSKEFDVELVLEALKERGEAFSVRWSIKRCVVLGSHFLMSRQRQCS